jgi:hypothetical protein
VVEVICEYCKNKILRKPYEVPPKGKRPKVFFCNWVCKKKWLHERHLFFKRRLKHFARNVWGTTPLERFGVGKSMQYGRKAEKFALETILPGLGFTEIVDFTNYSSQFYIDFVATYNGERVLVDATIKLSAYAIKKVKIADALRMPLYIVHVSPNNSLFYLKKLPKGQVTSKVPMSFIREHAAYQRVEEDSYLI